MATTRQRTPLSLNPAAFHDASSFSSASPLSPIPSIVMTHPDATDDQAVLLLSPSVATFPAKLRRPFPPSSPAYHSLSTDSKEGSPYSPSYAYPSVPNRSNCLTLGSALSAIRGVLMVAITIALIIVMFVGMAAATTAEGGQGLRGMAEWWSVKGLLKYGQQVEQSWKEHAPLKLKMVWNVDDDLAGAAAEPVPVEETESVGTFEEIEQESAEEVVQATVPRAPSRFARQRRSRSLRSSLSEP